MNHRWRLSKHERYKELCALASLGELPVTVQAKLRRHLETCGDCRDVYSDYTRINAILLPEISEDDETINGLEASTRAVVFDRIAGLPEQQNPRHQPPEARRAWPRFGRIAWAAAGVTAVAAIAFGLGVRYESFHNRGSLEAGKVMAPITAPAAPVPLGDVHQTQVESELRVALDDEHRRNALLRGSLEEENKRYQQAVSQNVALHDRMATEEGELANTRVLLATKLTELKQIQDASASDKTTLVSLQYQVQELTDKLNSETGALQRERDLLAKGREIRDIVGARNLHIVDVYDADARGHTKRAFARAFYTEGKSLVFYAYDLPAQREDAKLTYVAWGQKNGNKSSIRNLGSLVNDDQGQKRWSLNFSDPKTLAEIDSVFITLERVGDAGAPSGKRMLTAYLNDAVNHP